MIRLLALVAAGLVATSSVEAQPLPSLTLEQALARVSAQSPQRQGAIAHGRGAPRPPRDSPAPGRTLRSRCGPRTGRSARGSGARRPTRRPRRRSTRSWSSASRSSLAASGRRARRSATRTCRRQKRRSPKWIARCVLDTARLFLDVVRDRETLTALEQNRDDMNGLQRAMGARVREGMAAASDLAKFQAETARLETQTLQDAHRAQPQRRPCSARSSGGMAPSPRNNCVEPPPSALPGGDLAGRWWPGRWSARPTSRRPSRRGSSGRRTRSRSSARGACPTRSSRAGTSARTASTAACSA